MATLPTQCPSCRSALEVTKLGCPSCGTQLEGRFELSRLLRLSEPDLAFVLAFVQSSGSLKEMATLYRQSYPTIRNRLNDIIAQLKEEPGDRETKRCEILDAIATGKMSVSEAARRLKEFEP